jgi:hypothetical protein
LAAIFKAAFKPAVFLALEIPTLEPRLAGLTKTGYGNFFSIIFYIGKLYTIIPFGKLLGEMSLKIHCLESY